MDTSIKVFRTQFVGNLPDCFDINEHRAQHGLLGLEVVRWNPA